MKRIIEFFANGRKKINAPRRIVLSFVAVILTGALLLMLPISSVKGEILPFIDALFTATSAACVTGLIVRETGEYFTLFGQVVIIALIQVGGLGIMTIIAIAVSRANKRINMRDSIMVSSSLGVESAEDTRYLARHLLGFVAGVEGLGAIILACCFVPQYGIKGIWYGIFHSISAFCNAGFDLLATGNSLKEINGNYVVLITIALLIIIGGIGFLVAKDITIKKSLKKLTVYSKLVLVVTLSLIIGGAVAFLIFEHANAGTMGDLNWGEKILNSFFQSVTCRTAGFDSIGQSAMTEQSKLVSVLLMMAGGASGSTAGGIKVATLGIIVVAVITSLRSRSRHILWGREIGHEAVNAALVLLVLWFMLVMLASLAVSFETSASLIDSLFEVASAYGTVGLTSGVTAKAGTIVKILLIVYMFFGRVGLATISVLFVTHGKAADRIRYPRARVMIG